MPEKYEISLENGQIVFSMLAEDIPQALIAGGQLPPEYGVFCRMGDPSLLHCVALRHKEERGGIFIVSSVEEPLLACAARSDLAFVAGVGHFGDLVAKARYGADIFENPDGDHD